ncbi:uncharacterized protein GLRG_06523 [Colletotrichum graminicola M1.001]|uniref:RING-type domain-containing protein n=1 Tax=Colletotrichum graminicola (strain M1.001 / M2 / FGSC 10212) TaxID=645133 RepID=E3QKJ1_COLGM|nr:uncharacterized protein GLRG_06523 [Colletotrichum graminicola M1.001]EFQ31379.1 hypothetical protein GLRG_06523 [Colletotrichum graminicola M1.001]
MTAPDEASDTPAAAGPRTPTSTPQSPGTPTPAHQCRNCRASFCQPLGCGHVYCNECLGSPHSLAPGSTGCPECDRRKVTPPKPLTPEPKFEHEPNHESGELYLKRTRRISWVSLVMLLMIMVLGIIMIFASIELACAAGRLSSAKLP